MQEQDTPENKPNEQENTLREGDAPTNAQDTKDIPLEDNQDLVKNNAPKLPPVKPQSVEGALPSEPIIVAGNGQFDPNGVSIPSAIGSVLDAADELIPGLDEDGQPTPYEAVLMTAGTTDTEGEGEDAMADPKRDFRRIITSEGRRIGHRLHRLTSEVGATPANAVIAYRARTRRASGADAQLLASGVQIRFIPMDKTALYRLTHNVHQSRIKLGRATFGIGLSAQMAYTAEAFLNEARMHAKETSLQHGIDIGDAVRITDFQSLVWAMAAATFSDGFTLNRSCVASPGSCNHVATEHANIVRMMIHDRSSLSEEQLKFMAQIDSQRSTVQELESYQTKFTSLRTSDYEVVNSNGHSSIYTLRVPTLNEYIETSKAWVDEINASVVRTIGEQAALKERNSMMESLARAAAARRYTHWVQSIRTSPDDAPITDRRQIEAILGSVVSEDEVELESFFKAVFNHQEKTTVSLVVAPNWRCPNCNRFQMYTEGTTPEEEQVPLYTPVEAVNTFFGLTFPKLRRG